MAVYGCQQNITKELNKRRSIQVASVGLEYFIAHIVVFILSICGRSVYNFNFRDLKLFSTSTLLPPQLLWLLLLPIMLLLRVAMWSTAIQLRKERAVLLHLRLCQSSGLSHCVKLQLSDVAAPQLMKRMWLRCLVMYKREMMLVLSVG